MFYVGIDVGKNTHNASMIDETRKPVFKAYSFANTREGAQSLLERIRQKAPDTNQVEIGMEATGHYWLSLYSFLVDFGYVLRVINPILTDGWRKGVEIRKRKTDDIDSVLIAQLLAHREFVEAKLADEDLNALRTLTRFRSYLADSTSDLKRKVLCVLDQVFPEYPSIFSDVFGATSREVLLQYSSPADLEGVSVDQLTELLANLSRRKCGEEQARRLSEAASSSFGVTFCRDTFSFQLRLLLEQMKFIEQQVSDTEKQIKTLMEKIASPITSITGIGPVLGAVILGEIGDIERFESAKSLVSYAGIDAAISQSGQYESTSGHMTKRGSHYLRRALYLAATVAAVHDPTLRTFFEKKRAEGKHYSVCIGAVSRKLCYIIYTILKENRPYVKREVDAGSA
jgi:transposase